MTPRANVTSVEVIEAFRTNLILYLNKTRPTLNEVSADVLRIRLWLQNDQRIHWEGKVRRHTKELESAKQELFSASLANLRDTTAAEIMAVRRAERALDNADTKLKLVKRWDRDFDSQLAPLAKQLEKLNSILAADLPLAIAHLGEIITLLNSYAEAHSAPASADPPAAATNPQEPPSPAAEKGTP